MNRQNIETILAAMLTRLDEHEAKRHDAKPWLDQRRSEIAQVYQYLEHLHQMAAQFAEEAQRGYREGYRAAEERAARQPGRNALLAEYGKEGYRQRTINQARERWADHY